MRELSGKYIVIEGNDGTGKSTQVDLLAEYFLGEGREVCIVEEPGSDKLEKSTPVANEFRKLIKNGSLQRSPEINVGLFSAARRELWQRKIRPALARGEIVLSSRNYYSTLAYQGCGEGVSETEIIRMTRVFTDDRYMNPDISLILTLDSLNREKRIALRGDLENPDTFESRGDDFQNRVNQAYIEIAKQYNITTIDASNTVDEIQSKVREIVADKI